MATARQELEAAIGHYLRITCAYFDIHKNVEVRSWLNVHFILSKFFVT